MVNALLTDVVDKTTEKIEKRVQERKKLKLNKGDYAKLEDTLAEAVKDGADVRMKVEPVYSGNLSRPDEFRVSYTIDGDKEIVVFKNRSEE